MGEGVWWCVGLRRWFWGVYMCVCACVFGDEDDGRCAKGSGVAWGGVSLWIGQSCMSEEVNGHVERLACNGLAVSTSHPMAHRV